MKTNALAIVVLIATAAGCSKVPKPPVVDGRHRQPVNVGVTRNAVAPAPQHVAEKSASTVGLVPSPARLPSVPVKEVAVAPVPKVYTVNFPYGDTEIEASAETLASLLPYASHASRIEVRGRTDGKRWSKGDERVALGRALAARRLLVSKGINPKKITLNYLSGGDYAADNSTHDGQAVNRRVDIVMTTGN
jgi:outer membrane protein OmpA-like peptidoglycan-associated protein